MAYSPRLNKETSGVFDNAASLANQLEFYSSLEDVHGVGNVDLSEHRFSKEALNAIADLGRVQSCTLYSS